MHKLGRIKKLNCIEQLKIFVYTHASGDNFDGVRFEDDIMELSRKSIGIKRIVGWSFCLDENENGFEEHFDNGRLAYD